MKTSEIKFVNPSHETVMSAIINAGLEIKHPVMLTKTQNQDRWNVSMAFVSTGIHIPAEDIDVTELESLTDDTFGGRIIVNSVWEYKG